jgi:hypothetical protein
VEHLLAVDREQPREDTLGQAGAENDNLVRVRISVDKIATTYIVFLIHNVLSVVQVERNEGLRAPSRDL